VIGHREIEMLGSAPECPIDPESKAWIDRRWAWLIRQFGAKTLCSSQVILPTPEFFPDPFDHQEEDLQPMLDRVCGYMDVDPEEIQLLVYEERRPTVGESEGTAGLYRQVNGVFQIAIELSLLSDPLALVATMAHELGHVLLLGKGRISPKDEDHEPLTDLLTVFLGLGVFTANSVIREDNWIAGHVSGWSMKRQGYLTMPMFGYAFALFARDRDEGDPSWASELRKDVRASFEQSLRYLDVCHDKDDESTPTDNGGPKALPPTLKSNTGRISNRKTKGQTRVDRVRCTYCGRKLRARELAKSRRESDGLNVCSRCTDTSDSNDDEHLVQQDLDADVTRARQLYRWGFYAAIVTVALVVARFLLSWIAR
jgi:hypothetical protein